MTHKTQYNGRTHKIFTVEAFGKTHQIIVDKGRYANGTLALRAICLEETKEGFMRTTPFGTLTVNLCDLPENFQFVKNYSENKDWAEQLAKNIGGTTTGIEIKTGYARAPLYDFSSIDIYED